MPRIPLLSKLENAAGLDNLARSYRTMARAMVTRQSRDRLLRMAQKLEERSRKMNGEKPAGGA